MRSLESPDSSRQKAEWWMPAAGEVGREKVGWMGAELRLHKMIRDMEMVMVTSPHCECASCHRMIHFKMVKMVDFMSYVLP